MKNIFKRYDKYQFRVNIPEELEQYFNCKLFIKSLGTENKAHAIKLRNILYNKFQIIKDGINMRLSKEDIKNLVTDFKNTKLN